MDAIGWPLLFLQLGLIIKFYIPITLVVVSASPLLATAFLLEFFIDVAKPNDHQLPWSPND